MSTRQDMALGMKTLEEFSKVFTGSVVLHSDQGTLYTHAAFAGEPKTFMSNKAIPAKAIAGIMQ